jgi:hypothetical protein
MPLICLSLSDAYGCSLQLLLLAFLPKALSFGLVAKAVLALAPWT